MHLARRIFAAPGPELAALAVACEWDSPPCITSFTLVKSSHNSHQRVTGLWRSCSRCGARKGVITRAVVGPALIKQY